MSTPPLRKLSQVDSDHENIHEFEDQHHHEHDPETEEEFRKFFPTVDLRKVRIALGISSIVLLILSIIVIILASLNVDYNFRTSFTVAGVVSLVTSVASIYGTYSKDRGGLQFSYVLLIWGMAHATSYLFSSLATRNKFSTLCNEKSLSGVECGGQTGIASGQITIATLLFLLQLFMSWLTSNYSEKVQDAIAAFQRERDIKFSIENAAMKLRVAKRWKKAYQRVISGQATENEKAIAQSQFRPLPPLSVAGPSSGYNNNSNNNNNSNLASSSSSAAAGAPVYDELPPRPSSTAVPDRPDKPRRRVVGEKEEYP